MKKLAESAAFVLCIGLFILGYVLFKIAIKVGIVVWLEALGLPTWAALILGLGLGIAVIAILAFVFKPLIKKIDDWAEDYDSQSSPPEE